MSFGSSKSPRFFQSAEVTEVVGIQPLYLNKCIEREQYGIEASLRAGKGRGSRRLFSEEDVFGVALVWWLFESGLRSGAIQYVLNQICGGTLKSKASRASRILLERKAEVLVVRREPRTVHDADRDYPKQRVSPVGRPRALELTANTDDASLLIIPVGNLFAGLKELVRKLH